MKVIIQTILFVIVVTAALTMIFDHSVEQVKPVVDRSTEYKPVPVKRVSRFLQQKVRNPNAADHCHKDAEVCNYISEGGRNTTCCNNKCIDLAYDNHNCGACKKKCDATEACCNGECVNLAFDKRHCSECNTKCKGNGFCIYGTCDYA